jgi:hypothetical protein
LPPLPADIFFTMILLADADASDISHDFAISMPCAPPFYFATPRCRHMPIFAADISMAITLYCRRHFDELFRQLFYCLLDATLFTPTFSLRLREVAADISTFIIDAAFDYFQLSLSFSRRRLRFRFIDFRFHDISAAFDFHSPHFRYFLSFDTFASFILFRFHIFAIADAFRHYRQPLRYCRHRLIRCCPLSTSASR